MLEDNTKATVLAVGWHDRKGVKTYISTVGNTLDGTPHERQMQLWTGPDCSETYFEFIDRCNVVADFLAAASKIDVHNHLRQGRNGSGLGIEAAVGTKSWVFRVWQSFLGMSIIDSYLLYKYCHPKTTLSRRKFVENLVYKVVDTDLFNEPGEEPTGTRRSRRSAAPRDPSPAPAPRKQCNLAQFPNQRQVTCAVCNVRARHYCSACSNPASKEFVAVHAFTQKGGMKCFLDHLGLSLSTEWEKSGIFHSY